MATPVIEESKIAKSISLGIKRHFLIESETLSRDNNVRLKQVRVMRSNSWSAIAESATERALTSLPRLRRDLRAFKNEFNALPVRSSTECHKW